MIKRDEYNRRKQILIKDSEINTENRKLFKEFLEMQEYKLKRMNGLKELDEGCYKTLCSYISYLKNVNLWFKNKDWKKITKEDIKKVYDDLEDGKLKGVSGKIIEYKKDYYCKIFKGKPFELAGKKELAEEVMQFTTYQKKEVRFFEEQTFKKIVNATSTLHQRLLCWLAWDYGENIFTLLQLQKKDFVRRVDEQTHEPEYILVFKQDKIKRSRTARSEPTLYRETTDLLDSILPELKVEDRIFSFEHRNALKFLKQIRDKVGAKCIEGQEVTWKDFRSSMACHLLDLGWNTDEIKSRLGHKPSSDVLDMYVNYKALNKKVPKKKVEEGKIKQLVEQIEEFKHREKLNKRKFDELKEMKKHLELVSSQHNQIVEALKLKTAFDENNKLMQAVSNYPNPLDNSEFADFIRLVASDKNELSKLPSKSKGSHALKRISEVSKGHVALNSKAPNYPAG